MDIMLKRLMIFCLIFCCVWFPCLFLVITGNVNLFIDSYGVDSNDRIYIGKARSIEVYDSGSFQYSIDSRTPETYAFTITDDQIILATLSHVHTLNLQGEEISVMEDPYSSIYNRLNCRSRIFQSQNGDTYERIGYLGRTKIVKNDEQIVYQMDFLSFAVKILIAAGVVTLFSFVVFMIAEDSKRRKKGGYYEIFSRI